MDVVKLLNDGERGQEEHLVKNVYRAYYELDGVGRVPIIEKRMYSESARVDLDAERLHYWKGRGLRIPEIVIPSTDPKLINRPERDSDEHKTLFLSDLTQGNQVPVVDLYASEKKTSTVDLRDGAYVDQLENAVEVRRDIARALALMAADLIEPRMDYFFVKISGNTGELCLVDIEYYHPIQADELQAIVDGRPKTNYLLPYSGLSRIDEIGKDVINETRRLVTCVA